MRWGFPINSTVQDNNSLKNSTRVLFVALTLGKLSNLLVLMLHWRIGVWIEQTTSGNGQRVLYYKC